MAVQDMDMYCLDSVGKRFVENLDLVRASTAESEEFWKPRLEADLILPSHLDILLDDYILALGSERMNPKLISARLNTILLFIIAAAKEQNSQESSEWGSKDSVLLSIGEAATLPRAFNQEIYYLRSLADGILWYGEMKDLEANLVVQKVTRPIEEDKVAVPGVLLMMHQSRSIAGTLGSGMYGIVTDSYNWHLLWLNKDCKYFRASFDWMKDDERQHIINHIRDIVDNAICSIDANRWDSMTEGYSVNEVINCKIKDAYETHNAPDSD